MLLEVIVRTLATHRYRVWQSAWSCPCGVEGTGHLPRLLAEKHLAEEIKAEIERDRAHGAVSTNA